MSAAANLLMSRQPNVWHMRPAINRHLKDLCKGPPQASPRYASYHSHTLSLLRWLRGCHCAAAGALQPDLVDAAAPAATTAHAQGALTTASALTPAAAVHPLCVRCHWCHLQMQMYKSALRRSTGAATLATANKCGAFPRSRTTAAHRELLDGNPSHLQPLHGKQQE